MRCEDLALAKRAGMLGEPPPRLLTRRLLSAVGIRVARRSPTVDALSLAGHAAYGATMGAAFRALSNRPTTAKGILFGVSVWAFSYAGWIPKLGLMAPPAFDRPGRPTSMILAHVVYGSTLGVTTRAPRSRGRPSARSNRHA